MALIGIILLIGIVKKNAILMIDFAMVAERNHGLSPREAILEACMMRFRPIMMTTLAALLGALPLIFGIGGDAELRRPLGITMVGGLMGSQVLTLYTTPVVYLYLDRLRHWVNQKRGVRTDGALETPPETHPSLLALALVVALGGCAIGPDYQRPDLAVPGRIQGSRRLAPRRAARRVPARRLVELYGDQTPERPADAPGTFQQTLAQSVAQFRQAEALVRGARAAFFPSITGNVGKTRSGQGGGDSTVLLPGGSTVSSGGSGAIWYQLLDQPQCQLGGRPLGQSCAGNWRPTRRACSQRRRPRRGAPQPAVATGAELPATAGDGRTDPPAQRHGDGLRAFAEGGREQIPRRHRHQGRRGSGPHPAEKHPGPGHRPEVPARPAGARHRRAGRPAAGAIQPAAGGERAEAAGPCRQWCRRNCSNDGRTSPRRNAR